MPLYQGFRGIVLLSGSEMEKSNYKEWSVNFNGKFQVDWENTNSVANLLDYCDS